MRAHFLFLRSKTMRRLGVGLLCALLSVGMVACKDDKNGDDNGGETGNGDGNGNGNGNGDGPSTTADWLEEGCVATCEYDAVCDERFDTTYQSLEECVEECASMQNFYSGPASQECLDAIETLSKCEIEVAEDVDESCEAGEDSWSICLNEDDAVLDACADDYADFYADAAAELHASCVAGCDRDKDCSEEDEDEKELDYEICLEDCDASEELGAMIGVAPDCIQWAQDLMDCTTDLACGATFDDLMDTCGGHMDGLEDVCVGF